MEDMVDLEGGRQQEPEGDFVWSDELGIELLRLCVEVQVRDGQPNPVTNVEQSSQWGPTVGQPLAPGIQHQR